MGAARPTAEARRGEPPRLTSQARYGFLYWLPLVTAVISWGAQIGLLTGFIAFVRAVDNGNNRSANKADGIVALSGDPGRIELAIALLSKGWGRQLLISGHDHGLAAARLGAADYGLFRCCVEVDNRPRNTVEDAAATRRWVHENKLRSIVVVTSDYHMNRAILELDRVLPNVVKVPYRLRVVGRHSSEEKDVERFKQLVREFFKLGVAWAAGFRCAAPPAKIMGA